MRRFYTVIGKAKKMSRYLYKNFLLPAQIEEPTRTFTGVSDLSSTFFQTDIDYLTSWIQRAIKFAF